MTQELKEKIAKNAASGWCRCFKCDGVFDETNIKCEKEKLITCQQWYHGYRTALLALDDERLFSDLLENGVHGTIDYPLIGHDFPNIYPNYKELKYYCDKNGIKDEEKVKIIIIKDDIL